jgi:hypothetical protein
LPNIELYFPFQSHNRPEKGQNFHENIPLRVVQLLAAPPPSGWASVEREAWNIRFTPSRMQIAEE